MRSNRTIWGVLFLFAVMMITLQMGGQGENGERRVVGDFVYNSLENPSSLEEALQSYLTKHSQVVSLTPENKRDVKFLVYTSDYSAELSNRFFGLTSAFLFALLSNRFFLVEWAESFSKTTRIQTNKHSERPRLDDLLESPFEWDADKVLFDVETEEFQPKIELKGNCHPKKKVLLKPYEMLKCANYTEYFHEYQIIRVHAQEFFADWFRFNSFSKEIVGTLFDEKESLYGPLSRFLLHPKGKFQKIITNSQLESLNNFDYVIGLHIWSKGFQQDTNEIENEKALFSCVDQRMRKMSEELNKQRIGVFVCSNSFETKVRAAQYFGTSATFVDTSSLFLDDVKNEFIEMWLLGETNEIITTPIISNFTRSAAGRKNVPVFNGTQCEKHNTSEFWVRSPESCLLPSKCGKSIKHPWREDHPFWFTLRLIMFILIPLGIMLCVFKWCSDKRANCK